MLVGERNGVLGGKYKNNEDKTIRSLESVKSTSEVKNSTTKTTTFTTCEIAYTDGVIRFTVKKISSGSKNIQITKLMIR